LKLFTNPCQKILSISDEPHFWSLKSSNHISNDFQNPCVVISLTRCKTQAQVPKPALFILWQIWQLHYQQRRLGGNEVKNKELADFWAARYNTAVLSISIQKTSQSWWFLPLS